MPLRAGTSAAVSDTMDRVTLDRTVAPMLVRSLLALALLGAGSLSGCSAGPCVHTFEDEVLHLEEVRDAATGDALEEVVITELRYEGRAWGALSGDGLTDLGDGAARCRLPCSIAAQQEGRYELDLSADGYEATTLVVDATYQTFEGGCPSSNDDGTHATAELDPF